MSGSFHKQNPLNNYYRGPVRQRGSGIGSLALKVARHALPFLSKYVLPSAKRVGKDFALNLLPKNLMLSLVVVVNQQQLQALKRQ